MAWIQDKTGKNGWVLKCVSPATSKMKRDDWFDTSMSTNIAESAHAVSQKDGTHLSLVRAIQMGKKVDQRFLDNRDVASNMGIMSRTGNQTVTGRTERNLKRSKKAAAKRKHTATANGDEPAVNTLQIAENLIKQGVPAETIDKFLKSSMEK